MPLQITFSSLTSSEFVQHTIESKLEKRSKNVYGPLNGKKMMLFIDDLNMPKPDQFKTQQPLAFLKHFLEFNGFYSRDVELNWAQIVNIKLISAMTLKNSDSPKIDARLLSKMSLVSTNAPSTESLKHIFGTILERTHAHGVTADSLRTIISSTVEIFEFLKKNLAPTPKKFHYNFTMRDFSKIVEGVCMIKDSLLLSENQGNKLVDLWAHECKRIINDRLVDDSDAILVEVFSLLHFSIASF